MQRRVYGVPDQPVIEDARKLYVWTIGEVDYSWDDGTLRTLSDGPIIEIIGELPKYIEKSPQ